MYCSRNINKGIAVGTFLFLFLLNVGCQADAPARPIPSLLDCQPDQFETLANKQWSSQELATICTLWIGNLPKLPPDPTNSVADNATAVILGKKLFFDTRLSTNGSSCATCHLPDYSFTDPLPLPAGGGTRRTQTLIGVAYSSWFFWDGHKDSLWAQSLEPLESANEHQGSREQYAQLIAEDLPYKTAYQELFGPLPEDVTTRAGATEIFVNLGKSLAAFERTLMPTASRFDHYAEAVLSGQKPDDFSADERAGLKLFLGKGQCINCHNGPLFTNNEFHNTAVFGDPDDGRATGIKLALQDEFNCYSSHSGVAPEQCLALRFALKDDPALLSAFKTPTLRNVAEHPPYMHNGSLKNLLGVVEHYNVGGFGNGVAAGHNELTALNMSEAEMAQLEAFMESLTGTTPVYE